MPYQSIFAKATPTPQPQSGGYQSIFSTPKPTQSSTPVQSAPKVSGSTNGIPNTALQGNLGGGYGASNITDLPGEKSVNSFSLGKPLLTFLNTKTMSSQLLSDRTAPTFNPTVAQKIDPAILQNGRMPDTIRVSLKQALGGSTWQELDHMIPLELGGSNAKGNLQLEPGKDTSEPYGSGNPTATDPIENQLAAKVHGGDKSGLSLVDAWRLMAKAKGITLPEDGGKVPNQDQFPQKNIQSLKDKASIVGLNLFPATLKTLSELQLDPLSLKSDPTQALNDRAKSMASALAEEGKNISDFFDSLDSNKTSGDRISATTNLAIGGINTLISPVTSLFAAANDIPVLGSLSRLVGVFINAVGEGATLSAKAIASQTIDKIPGLSQSSKDKITDAYGKINALAYQFGVPMAAEDLAGVRAKLEPKFGPQDTQTIIDKAQNLADGKDILNKPTLADIAEKPEVKDRSTMMADKYQKDVIEPNKKGATILNADKLKEFNGKDYNDQNHPMYSKATKTLYDKAIRENPDPVVKMTAGGTGSGKSELISSELSKNFKGVIYDSTLSNYEGARKMIDDAKAQGKSVEIHAVLPDLQSARLFTLIREAETGRGVSLDTFANTHSQVVDTLIKLANDGEDVRIYDNSGIKTREDFAKPRKLLVGDEVLAKLNEKRYTKDEIKTHVKNVKYENNKPERVLARNENGDVSSSRKNGADKGGKPNVKERSGGILRKKSGFAKQLKPIEGTGKEKIRGLSKGVEAKTIASTPSRLPSFAPEEAKGIERTAVARKLTDIFGELPTYKTMNVADQGARAIDLFEKDPEAAKQIAYGAKAPPKGLTPEAVYIAVEQHAIENQDIQTLKELANSRLTQEATTMGQRIRMLAERNPERPTDAIRAVQEARVKAVQDKIGEPIEKATKKIVEQEAPKVKDFIEKAKSTRKISWAEFAESIKC